MDREIEGVILDAVGTTIEPDPPVAIVYAEAARRQGLDLDAGDIRRRFERSFRGDESDERLGALATDEATEARRWRRIVADVLPDLPDPERGFAELWDHFARASSWRAFPDVGPAIERIRRAGLGLVIASNFDGRLRAVARGLPELDGADLVISSEVGVRKPHPDFYRAACERLGLPPDRVLSVGDDLENDVLGAQRAGLRAVLLDRKGRRPEGIACIDRLDELPR
jgi:putative hydrolase of the HAD superfamily